MYDPAPIENVSEPAVTRLETSEPQTVVPPEELCDLDSDGDCDNSDLKLFRSKHIHSCRNQPSFVKRNLGIVYEPRYDTNQDGCISFEDAQELFGTVYAR